jgi:hypothetical protein
MFDARPLQNVEYLLPAHFVVENLNSYLLVVALKPTFVVHANHFAGLNFRSGAYADVFNNKTTF